MYWLDSWKNPAPGVPLSRARVQQLVEVQVDAATLTDKPAGLVVISPLEILHAIFLKAAEDLGKAGVTAACKTAWKEALTFD